MVTAMWTDDHTPMVWLLGHYSPLEMLTKFRQSCPSSTFDGARCDPHG